MTTERMLELLILGKFMSRYESMSLQAKEFATKRISISQMMDRYSVLEEEFLESYVIDNAEKSE